MKRSVWLAILIATFGLASWLTSPPRAEAWVPCDSYHGQVCGPPISPPFYCRRQDGGLGYCVCRDYDPSPVLSLAWDCSYSYPSEGV
jgi:hypothetical protein